tara:strand:+ start:467 stop:931 length:465 start_codon:yes stop_codon:yes gene_type:complete
MTQAAIKTTVKKYQSTLAFNRVANKNGRPETNITTQTMSTGTRLFSNQGDTARANNGRLNTEAIIKKTIPALYGAELSFRVKKSKPVKNDREIRKIVLTPTGYFFSLIFVFYSGSSVHFRDLGGVFFRQVRLVFCVIKFQSLIETVGPGGVEVQ